MRKTLTTSPSQAYINRTKEQRDQHYMSFPSSGSYQGIVRSFSLRYNFRNPMSFQRRFSQSGTFARFGIQNSGHLSRQGRSSIVGFPLSSLRKWRKRYSMVATNLSASRFPISESHRLGGSRFETISQRQTAKTTQRRSLSLSIWLSIDPWRSFQWASTYKTITTFSHNFHFNRLSVTN